MMVHMIKVSELETMNLRKDDPEPSHWQLNQVKEKEAEIAKIVDERPRKFLSGIAQHLAFQVDDVDSVINALKEHNIKHYVVEHKRIAAKGNKGSQDMLDLGVEKQVFFYDPDGNGMEIGNYGEEFPPFDPEETTVKAAKGA